MKILRYHDAPKRRAIRQKKYVKIAACAALMLGATQWSTPASADNVSFKDFPYLIYCEYDGIGHVYYLSKLDTEKRAIYLTPDRLAGMITIDGVAQRVGGDQSGTCADKTLEELRAAGQAYDLPR